MLYNEWKDLCKYMGDKPDQTEEEAMIKRISAWIDVNILQRIDFILNDLDRKIDELWEGTNSYLEPTRPSGGTYGQFIDMKTSCQEERK